MNIMPQTSRMRQIHGIDPSYVNHMKYHATNFSLMARGMCEITSQQTVY